LPPARLVTIEGNEAWVLAKRSARAPGPRVRPCFCDSTVSSWLGSAGRAA